MSKDTVTIYKLFWADQDVEQEQWLREQSRNGLQLRSVNPLCGFTFTRGAAQDVVYRIDFHSNWDTGSYRQLFEDDGWEHAASVAGWQYWRKAAGNGAEPQIFTDLASQVSKYRQVLLLVAICSLPLAAMVISPRPGAFLDAVSGPGMVVIGFAVLVALPINAYGAWRLFKRIRRLRAAAL